MMETRKVQVTGGSTFTVSLPKEWARDNDVGAGDAVTFFPEKESLLLTPKRDDEPTRGSMSITGLTGEHLTRSVMAMYVSGFDIIELTADRITTDQRRAIRAATQSLVGLEVLEETHSEVVIQDLLDSSELSINNAVTRMQLISLSMLQDAVTALVEDDDDIARDVIERDDDVDRLWFVVSRIFRSTLRSPRSAQELGIPREICFDYHSSARQLERIADHSAKIADAALELDEIPTSIAEEIMDLHDEAHDIIEMSMEALMTDDPARATELSNEARERIESIDNWTRELDELLRDLDPGQAKHLGIIVDSLSRGADYGGNIAETALQKAAPKP